MVTRTKHPTASLMALPLKSGTINNNQIKELLMDTTDSFVEIAEKCGSSISTVKRINLGQTHYDKELSYPLRK